MSDTFDKLLDEYTESVYKLVTIPKVNAWSYIGPGQQVEKCRARVVEYFKLCVEAGREPSDPQRNLPYDVVEGCACEYCTKARNNG